MRLTLRFFLLVGALLAAVAASAGAGHRALNTLDAALTRVVDTDMQRLLAITHARRVFRSMTVLERDFILARSASERDGVREKMKKLGDELTEHLNRYEALMEAEDKARVDQIRAVRERWLMRDAAVLAAAVTDTDRALALAKLHKQDPVSWETEIIARDVTERMRGEDAERSAREQQSIIAKLLADKVGFAQFVADTEQLIDALLAETDAVIVRRHLHTLKGNVGLFGMQIPGRRLPRARRQADRAQQPSAFTSRAHAPSTAEQTPRAEGAGRCLLGHCPRRGWDDGGGIQQSDPQFQAPAGF